MQDKILLWFLVRLSRFVKVGIGVPSLYNNTNGVIFVLVLIYRAETHTFVLLHLINAIHFELHIGFFTLQTS